MYIVLSASAARTTDGRPRKLMIISSAGKVHLASLWPWPLTSDLDNLLAVTTYVVNTCRPTKFHQNLSTMKWRYHVTRNRLMTTDNGQTDGCTTGQQNASCRSLLASRHKNRKRCITKTNYSINYEHRFSFEQLKKRYSQSCKIRRYYFTTYRVNVHA